MSPESLRVIIADDHPLFRSGLRALLLAEPGIEVVGEAQTGTEAVALAAQYRPDIILMDLQLPGLGGIDATRQIRQMCPQCRVLVVTMFEEEQSVFAAMRAGAHGYLLKGTAPEDMLRAIQAISKGEAIFSPAIATKLLDFFADVQPTILPHALHDLTDREYEILNLIAQGQNNAVIARHLSLSPKTVANYASSILSKLQVTDRAQAMLRARQAGLGEPNH